MAERKRTSGDVSAIDPDIVAEAVRAALLEELTRIVPEPIGFRAYRVSVLWTAFVIFLLILWQVGRAFGLN